MQKVNVDVHIWNELRSNDRFGFNARRSFAEHFPFYVPTAHCVSRYRSSAATTSPLGDTTPQSDTACT